MLLCSDVGRADNPRLHIAHRSNLCRYVKSSEKSLNQRA